MKSLRLKKQTVNARRRMKKRKNRRRSMYVVIFLWSLLGCVGLFTSMQRIFNAVMNIKGQTYQQTAYQCINEKHSQQKVVKSNKTAEPAGLLVIANKDHELPEDYDPGLRPICNGRLQAASILYDDLTAMLSDAGTEGYDYWIASAYRSRERQQELIDEDVREFMKQGMDYDAALEKTLKETLPAGHSEHETGLSLDILCAGNTDMDITQSYEPGNQWLVQHCAEYGFILRYPADKEEITGISYEPWHFRYVGKKAAKQIMKQGITLEEYCYQLPD